MNEIQNLADESKKLLDNGAYIVLFQNELGTYTAVALHRRNAYELHRFISHIPDYGQHIAADRKPSQALYRLTEKRHCEKS